MKVNQKSKEAYQKKCMKLLDPQLLFLS